MAPPATPGTSALARVSMPLRFVIGVALFAIVGFAYWLVFFSDVSNKIGAADRQSGELKGQLNAARQAEGDYLKDKDELALRMESAKAINKVAPPEKQQAAFLSYIREAATQSGVELQTYAPLDEVPQPYFIKDPMRIEIIGKFHQIAKFTWEIGKLERAINLENIEITEPKLTGDELKLRGKCLATAFHTVIKKAPAAPGAPGQPGAPPAPGAPK